MTPTTLIQYPAGALLRVRDICGDRKAGKPGLLPIVPRTWLKWVEQGKVPAGIKLGPRTRAWPIEVVLQMSQADAQNVRAKLPAAGQFERHARPGGST